MKASATAFVPKKEIRSRQKNKEKMENYHHNVEQISDQLERIRISLQDRLKYVRAAQESFREVRKEYQQAEKAVAQSEYTDNVFKTYEPSIKKHIATMRDIHQLANR